LEALCSSSSSSSSSITGIFILATRFAALLYPPESSQNPKPAVNHVPHPHPSLVRALHVLSSALISFKSR
jgi:hypothetical protein